MTRPLVRASIVCAAAALALSACSGKSASGSPTTPSPAVSASASESAEATPAPGEWTLDDLKVGAKVPKEDLERLFPKWEVPEPPATLTEFSEQGAKDAALYYDRLADIALYFSDAGLVGRIDNDYCKSCETLRDGVSNGLGKNSHLSAPTKVQASAEADEVKPSLYKVEIRDVIDHAVQQSNDSLEILSFESSTERKTYTLIYYDGTAWLPVFLKVNEEDL